MVLFRKVHIFDGSGSPAFQGSVLVDKDRIAAISRADELQNGGTDCAIIEGNGMTLMPGLTEAHAHLSWPSSVERFVPGMHLPPEDMLLTTARNARILLDHGFTSAYSAGALGKTLESSLKRHIDDGGMPGPRLIPSSIEREPPSDNNQLTAGTVSEHARGPESIRNFIKEVADGGAKIVKFLLSGESALQPGASMKTLYTEEEMAAAQEAAAASNVWLSAHAHAPDAIKMALRHGFRVLYHCTYADEEAIEMLVARRDQVFIGPTLGIVQATLDAKPPPHFDMSHMKSDARLVLEAQKNLIPILKSRGVRILPGGDYGFPFNPNGHNARDLELFVRHFGFTAIEALSAATKLGGEIMGMPEELGQIKQGYLADLLLVRGDPTTDVSILENKENLVGIMKNGAFYKTPPALH